MADGFEEVRAEAAALFGSLIFISVGRSEFNERKSYTTITYESLGLFHVTVFLRNTFGLLPLFMEFSNFMKNFTFKIWPLRHIFNSQIQKGLWSGPPPHEQKVHRDLF